MFSRYIPNEKKKIHQYALKTFILLSRKQLYYTGNSYIKPKTLIIPETVILYYSGNMVSYRKQLYYIGNSYIALNKLLFHICV